MPAAVARGVLGVIWLSDGRRLESLSQKKAVYEAVRAQLTGTAAGGLSRDPPQLNQSPSQQNGPPAIPKSLVDSLAKWKWSA